MFNKLTVHQISDVWDYVKYVVEEALPPTASTQKQRMGNILNALMSGAMECWVVYDKKEDEKIIDLYGVGLTVLNTDVCSGVKSITIYAVATFRETPLQYWEESLTGIVNYAKSKGCERVLGFSNIDKIKNLFVQAGGSADYTLMVLPVDNYDRRRIYDT